MPGGQARSISITRGRELVTRALEAAEVSKEFLHFGGLQMAAEPIADFDADVIFKDDLTVTECIRTRQRHVCSQGSVAIADINRAMLADFPFPLRRSSTAGPAKLVHTEQTWIAKLFVEMPVLAIHSGVGNR